jgi:hypothetical protein
MPTLAVCKARSGFGNMPSFVQWIGGIVKAFKLARPSWSGLDESEQDLHAAMLWLLSLC